VESGRNRGCRSDHDHGNDKCPVSARTTSHRRSECVTRSSHPYHGLLHLTSLILITEGYEMRRPFWARPF
jgi:hypothetical protein